MLKLVDMSKYDSMGCTNNFCNIQGTSFNKDLPLQYAYHQILTCAGANPIKFLQEIVIQKVKLADLNKMVGIDKIQVPQQTNLTTNDNAISDPTPAKFNEPSPPPTTRPGVLYSVII